MHLTSIFSLLSMTVPHMLKLRIPQSEHSLGMYNVFLGCFPFEVEAIGTSVLDNFFSLIPLAVLLFSSHSI
jgi:hypothetical protein